MDKHGTDFFDDVEDIEDSEDFKEIEDFEDEEFDYAIYDDETINKFKQLAGMAGMEQQGKVWSVPSRHECAA